MPAWHAAHALAQVDRAAALVGDPDLVDRYRTALAPWEGLVCWQGTCAYGPVAITAARLAAAAGDGKEARRLTGVARKLARSLQAPVFERDLGG